MKVPAFMLKKLYVPKSLQNEAGGFGFRMRNTLMPATLVGLPEVSVDGEAVDPARITAVMGDQTFTMEDKDKTATFKKDSEVVVRVKESTLPPGRHVVTVKQRSKEFDVLQFDFEDTI